MSWDYHTDSPWWHLDLHWFLVENLLLNSSALSAVVYLIFNADFFLLLSQSDQRLLSFLFSFSSQKSSLDSLDTANDWINRLQCGGIQMKIFKMPFQRSKGAASPSKKLKFHRGEKKMVTTFFIQHPLFS